ncbi:MAG: hypothetical protein ABIK52_03805, partial [Bacteroidota bacterium]
SEIILPSKGSTYYQVLQDPFGIGVLTKDTAYANPNRFFAHYSASLYMKQMPLILQVFVNPIDSIYLSSAILKTVVQIVMLYLLSVCISKSGNIFRADFILAAILITPLFQASGYNSYIGIIDQSIIYTFFYALPLTLLLVYFLPFYRAWMNGQPTHFNWVLRVSFVILIIILSFNGPLIPGIIVIICPLILFHAWWGNFRKIDDINLFKRLIHSMVAIPGDLIFFFLISICMSLYSLYLGTHNLLNESVKIPLLELYRRLPLGFFYQFTEKAAFPLILLVIVVNLFLMRKRSGDAKVQKILILARWIGVFSILYILLLPLGGYRVYRPNVLRYDTIMPVTVCLIFLFGISTHFLIKHLPRRVNYVYITSIVLILLAFARADEPRFQENRCEKKALQLIADSPDTIVHLSQDCHVMSWNNITDIKDSERNASLLLYWGVTPKKTLYYQSE